MDTKKPIVYTIELQDPTSQEFMTAVRLDLEVPIFNSSNCGWSFSFSSLGCPYVNFSLCSQFWILMLLRHIRVRQNASPNYELYLASVATVAIELVKPSVCWPSGIDNATFWSGLLFCKDFISLIVWLGNEARVAQLSHAVHWEKNEDGKT